MKKISLAEVTLRTAHLGGHELTFKEKLEAAKLMDKLGVSVIELPALGGGKADSLLAKSVASTVKNAVVSIPAAFSEDGIAEAWEAVKGAKHPRIQLIVPVSPVQMEYVSHKKPAIMLQSIEILVKKAAALCADVEFFAEDATRAEPEFFAKAVSTAIACGAATVTVSDAAGTMLPDEAAKFISDLKTKVPELANVRLGVQFADTIRMALACSCAAVTAGVDEIKVATGDSFVANIVALCFALRARPDYFGVEPDVRMTELMRTTEQIERIVDAPHSKGSALENGIRRHDDPDILSVHDDIAAVSKAVRKIGYDLSDDDTVKVYDAFRRIADKKDVSLTELDTIVAINALQVPPTYQLESYTSNSGNIVDATAHVKLIKDKKLLSGLCVGDGPIDAAFLAIEQITGSHYELDDFQILAVTEGREAMGSALVRLRSGGKLYSGRGISTDIIGASIRAYLNALNKIVYEEQ